MDSDLGSSMLLLRMLPAATAAISVVVTLMLFGPVVLYVIARWRAHRAPVIDPQLGLKFALHWFATAAFHLALAGAMLLIFTIIAPGMSAAKGDQYRIAFAALVPAGLVLGLHAMLLRRTNDLEVPGVRRLFLGYNMIVTGLVGFVALVMGFQLLFAKGSVAPMGHLAGSAILVYCSAWAVLGWRLNQLVLGDWSGGAGVGVGVGGVPDDIVTPRSQQQQQPPTTATGGGSGGSGSGGGSGGGGGGSLPSLGGGSYPPIEPR
jgi:hypothetical protein